jgi:hypothetical protein
MGEHNFLTNLMASLPNKEAYREWHNDAVGQDPFTMPLSFPCLAVMIWTDYRNEIQEPFFLYPGDTEGLFDH